jgi:hypothetical protein
MQHRRTERHFQHQMMNAQGQMAASAKVNNAQLWLSFREFLSKYDEVHVNLHPRSKDDWQEPKDAKEQVKVELYMGLFEHANRMLDMGLIDLETFKDIYRYRITNIISNNWVRTHKIEKEGNSWLNFIRLCHKVERQSLLPLPWSSVELVKPDVVEFSILLELNEPIYKGVKHIIIIKVVDTSSQGKIADVNVVGEITKQMVDTDTRQMKTVAVIMLDSGKIGKSGQLTYPITITEEGEFTLSIRGYAADFTNIIPYKKRFKVTEKNIKS